MAGIPEQTSPNSNDLDDELCEPKFKYKRVQNDVAKILLSDAASCLAVHPKFIAIGTQKGRVYVFDHLGNKIAGNNVPPHAIDVNQISVDKAGEWLASCANDGKIVIYAVCGSSPDNAQVITTDRPVRSVALDPEYGKSGGYSSQAFTTGDRCLTLHERGLLGATKRSIVYDGRERDGLIHNIAWYGQYILFANDTGVRLFDRSQKCLITHVNRRHDLTLDSKQFPARLVWFDDRNFGIGWADRVTICQIKENKNYNASNLLNIASKSVSNVNNKFVEIKYLWELTDHYVSGLSYTQAESVGIGSVASSLNDLTEWQELVLFCTCKAASPQYEAISRQNGSSNSMAPNERHFETGDDDPMNIGQPRVLLLEPVSLQEFAVLNEDIIEMQGAEEQQTPLSYQYHLAGVRDENTYFIMGVHDLIQVYPCNADDHVSWLLDNEMFKKALDFAKHHCKQLQRQTVNGVGRRYLDHLISTGQFLDAARLCPEVCGRRKDVWEEYASQFERHNQLKQIAPFLPVQDPQLEPECYQSVLLDFLKDDFVGFKDLVFQWSPDLYRTGALINETLKRLYNDQAVSQESHRLLLSTLALLYTYERNYERSLEIYMKLCDKSVFSMIDRYQLFELVKDRIQELMNIDTDLAVRLLLENSDNLPASTVMNQLNRQPKLQLAYLDKLFSRGEGQEFADLAISLYADYNRTKLLPFLRNSEHYKLDKALEICRSKELGSECVFLLGRGGNRREALRFLTRQMKNVLDAVEFCKEHDDADLWLDLIEHCSSNAQAVNQLIESNIGAHVDPRLLIAKMKPGLDIVGLKQSLIKLLKDYSSQIELQHGCRRVLYNDSYRTLQQLVHRLKSGVSVAQRADSSLYNGRPKLYATCCKVCGKSVNADFKHPANNSGDDGIVLDDVLVVWCKHCIHSKCAISMKRAKANVVNCCKVKSATGSEGFSAEVK